jgi:hypothetical protein
LACIWLIRSDDFNFLDLSLLIVLVFLD